MRIRTIFTFLFFLLLSGSAVAMEASDNANSHPLPVGAAMPDLLLRGELSAEHLAHLGLKGPAPRHLSEINAKTVILVAFSMYCPHCQREAPALNDLNALIASRGLSEEVKLIGVGIGNSDFEVQVFRDKYATTFPLFSDPDFRVNKELGEVGTPFFYVLAMNPEKKEIRVVKTLLGRMESAESFFDQAMKACE
ncbi:peroxiredoxin family protein [Desulfomicrobium baculatum]|uniref:Alkyl hydroperoxide reductase/ Thiol specific antioxidant/ Mal allergen n=1 Tax=Desulfomicrobium baculatum (strain DSM 4028 / VKM B-1378 / X) TaxID=525897 RepID=C7LQE0_DESBD|nr:TlpA disulfide reductase family protein [Desulfomicrobium baculatum]ACU90342.1 alkyl hydroperoxide reductase/ Thiol specific antioxidant/ Mal allergen [Desulfomicrobium baculatum DSM 4028]